MAYKCQCNKKDGSKCGKEISTKDAYVLSLREQVDTTFPTAKIPLRKKKDLLAVETKFGWGTPICRVCLPLKEIQAQLIEMEIWSFPVDNRQEYLVRKFKDSSPEGGPTKSGMPQSGKQNATETLTLEEKTEKVADEDSEWEEVRKLDDDEWEEVRQLAGDQGDVEEEGGLADILDAYDQDESEEQEEKDEPQKEDAVRSECYCCGNSLDSPLHYLPDILEVSNPLSFWRGSPVCPICAELIKHAQLPVVDVRMILKKDLQKNIGKFNSEDKERNPFCPLCLSKVSDKDRWLDIRVQEFLPEFTPWAGKRFCVNCVPRLYEAKLKVWPLTDSERESRQSGNLEKLLKKIRAEQHDDDCCLRCGNYLKGFEAKTSKINRNQKPGTPMYEYRGRLVCDACVELFKNAGVSLFFPYNTERKTRRELSDVLEGDQRPFGANVRDRQRYNNKRRSKHE